MTNKVFILIILSVILLIILYIFYYLVLKNKITDKKSEKYILTNDCKCYINPNSNIIKIINIYSSDCEYSDILFEAWTKVKERYRNRRNLVTIEEYEAEKDKEIVKQFNVEGYPTILIIKGEKIYEYPSNMSLEFNSINNWINEFIDEEK